MIAEFNWWLLIVGLVVGAGLTWLVVTDTRRREIDVEEAEVADEAAWLAMAMAEEGEPIPADVAERMLRLHRIYLGVDLPTPGPASVGNDAAVEGDHPEPEPPVRDAG